MKTIMATVTAWTVGRVSPQARVEAVQAVRCVGCAEVKERGRRLAAGRRTQDNGSFG